MKGKERMAETLEPPTTHCENCDAPPGTWCGPGCREAPLPPGEADACRRDSIAMGELITSILTMLAQSISDEETKAKNYVEATMEWHKGMMAELPFTRVAVTFFRKDGLSPHERATIALNEALDAKADLISFQRRYDRLAEACHEDQTRIGILKRALEIKADIIVDLIARDLNGRSGLGVDELDDETQDDIKAAWTKIVTDASSLATAYAGE